MIRELSPIEAFKNFVETVVPTLSKPLPDEIRRAKTDQGRDKKLGTKRIQRLLETYAPGRYRFEIKEVVYLTDTDGRK